VQVELTCKHGDVKENVREVLITKSEKIIHYFERVTAIQVVVDFEGGRVKVEILVDAEHKHNFVASDIGDEVQSTFDRALHKMEQQIRKYKEKIQDHRRGLQAKQVDIELPADDADE